MAEEKITEKAKKDFIEIEFMLESSCDMRELGVIPIRGYVAKSELRKMYFGALKDIKDLLQNRNMPLIELEKALELLAMHFSDPPIELQAKESFSEIGAMLESNCTTREFAITSRLSYVDKFELRQMYFGALKDIKYLLQNRNMPLIELEKVLEMLAIHSSDPPIERIRGPFYQEKKAA